MNAWCKTVTSCKATNIHDLKQTFNLVDNVGKYFIFDVEGSNYRIITAIYFKLQILYIRAIWTHEEYTKCMTEQMLSKGKL